MDILTAAHAIRLLTCNEPAVEDTAWACMRREEKHRIRFEPNERMIADYMSRSLEAVLARPVGLLIFGRSRQTLSTAKQSNSCVVSLLWNETLAYHIRAGKNAGSQHCSRHFGICDHSLTEHSTMGGSSGSRTRGWFSSGHRSVCIATILCSVVNMPASVTTALSIVIVSLQFHQLEIDGSFQTVLFCHAIFWRVHLKKRFTLSKSEAFSLNPSYFPLYPFWGCLILKLRKSGRYVKTVWYRLFLP